MIIMYLETHTDEEMIQERERERENEQRQRHTDKQKQTAKQKERARTITTSPAKTRVNHTNEMANKSASDHMSHIKPISTWPSEKSSWPGR